MAWWHKLRKAWIAITARLLKSRKIENGKVKMSNCNNDGGEACSHSNNHREINNSFLKLQSDVESCDYEDVHVLWNLLHRMHAQDQAATATTSSSSSLPPPPPPPADDETNVNRKNKHPWKAFL